ncbi:hypothetical protein AYJ54_12040 [Bradyrhizobium centrolobii]|uniref:Transcriptional regulator LacI/GalR-like sensor domain-containing protein n=1 Tax=Bradyrhizobium centrolobii TaxID=1505087 RepID=A0A176YQM6_9BRAD|nr:hypothetical protein AYJ54_12040 [Bradyrhizobium centrolobii]
MLGFGDNDSATQITPGRATITFDSAALGHIAGQLLLARLTGTPNTEPRRAVERSFVERGSV